MIRRETAIALLGALAAASLAIAQGQAPAPGDEPPHAAAPRANTAVPRSTRDSVLHADARVCLEFRTNPEVIMCAEKYRPHRGKA